VLDLFIARHFWQGGQLLLELVIRDEEVAATEEDVVGADKQKKDKCKVMKTTTMRRTDERSSSSVPTGVEVTATTSRGAGLHARCR
jgi:hypothetical protein